MQPHQSYHPDVSIDLEKHHKRNNWTDSIAYWAVKSLRIPTDLFFQVRQDSSFSDFIMLWLCTRDSLSG